MPTQRAADVHYKFNDVVKQDLVKIWIERHTINPAVDIAKMVGRVQTVQATGKKDGLAKVITGLDQGEILQRRLTGRKSWTGKTANEIVTELATDLSLGTSKISADAHTIASLVIDDQTYFEVLKKTSDYWVSAGVQINKDFYVDEVNDLVWKARPFRTTGVIKPTYKTDFTDYTLVTDAAIGELHNRINVYGKRVPFNAKDLATIGRKYPVDGDAWTYDANWVVILGTLVQQLTTPKVGTDCCTVAGDGSYTADVKHLHTMCSVDGVAGFSQNEFWLRKVGAFDASGIVLRIHAPDGSNYFQTNFAEPASDGVWTYYIRALGPNNMNDAINNPTGEWFIGAGAPSWDKMSAVEFLTQQFAPTSWWDIDGLCYSYGRWRHTAYDPTGAGIYGLHETTFTDDDLGSDAECQVRAESLLFQEKDPVQRLDFSVRGTSNVQLGDQIAITLPPENLSAANFQLMTIEHETVLNEGWVSKLTLLGTNYTRKVPPRTTHDAILRELKRHQELGRGMRKAGK